MPATSGRKTSWLSVCSCGCIETPTRQKTIQVSPRALQYSMAWVASLCHYLAAEKPRDLGRRPSFAHPHFRLLQATEPVMPLTVGVLKETSANEARVALTPDVAAKLAELKVEVRLEHGAGERSHLPDDLYRGAVFAPSAHDVLAA